MWTLADEIRIHQIVANLVENSAKYTPSGGEITVRTFPQDGDAVLEVSDTGAGLSPDLLPRVFDLFAQGKKVALDLTLVRRLVELHEWLHCRRKRWSWQGGKVYDSNASNRSASSCSGSRGHNDRPQPDTANSHRR